MALTTFNAPGSDPDREVAEMRRIGDEMQSAASRLVAYLEEINDTLPEGVELEISYEERMAMHEAKSCIEQWTGLRRATRPS